MAEDPAFLKELREDYDSANGNAEEKQVVKSDDPVSLKSESGELGESKQKQKDPKDNFVVDDGVDRDAEWEQYEKDEAKRKADRKAKDESDKKAEQKFREETKEKVWTKIFTICCRGKVFISSCLLLCLPGCAFTNALVFHAAFNLYRPFHGADTAPQAKRTSPALGSGSVHGANTAFDWICYCGFPRLPHFDVRA